MGMSDWEAMPERGEIVECLESGLQFLRGETTLAAQKLAIRVLANIIIEHLDISGYDIRYRPTLQKSVDNLELQQVDGQEVSQDYLAAQEH